MYLPCLLRFPGNAQGKNQAEGSLGLSDRPYISAQLGFPNKSITFEVLSQPSKQYEKGKHISLV